MATVPNVYCEQDSHFEAHPPIKPPCAYGGQVEVCTDSHLAILFQ